MKWISQKKTNAIVKIVIATHVIVRKKPAIANAIKCQTQKADTENRNQNPILH